MKGKLCNRLGVNSKGMALIITLSLLLLMAVLIVAFFSKVLLDRNIRKASAARDQTAVLARSAVGMITGDLLHEIATGSIPDDAVSPDVPYFAPRPVDLSANLLGSTVALTGFPSMAPQQMVSTTLQITHPALLKESRNNQPGFVIPSSASTSGYEARTGMGTPPARASGISTTAAAIQSRGIPATSWDSIKLGTSAAPEQDAPDWVYLDRSGNTPVFSGNAVSANEINRDAGNPNHVIGRFAYRIYDVGGLLPLNQLGDGLELSGDPNVGEFGDLSSGAVSGLPDMQASNLNSFLTWRDEQTPGGRGFQLRQDLIRVVGARGDIPMNGLRWFNDRAVYSGTPAFFPNANLIEATPADLEADLINPDLPGIRFAGNTTLTRGTEEDFTVPPGTTVMPRKFPLQKLDLLSDLSTSAEDLMYFFGLTRQTDGSFRYTAVDTDGVIKELSAVAAEGREPNFFEVLQAVISTGSLGRNAGNSYTVDHERDGLRTRQIWQIGANIIDQWDQDDFPTTIHYEVPATGSWEPVYGVENLPYLNSMAVIAHRPEYDRDRFQVWSVFDVWNPHQNANTPPSGIDGFRIIPVQGSTRLTINLTTQGFAPLDTHIPQTALNNGPQDIVALNAGRFVEFPANSSYEIPVLLGGTGQPDGAAWSGGILLHDFDNVSPAVPDQIETLVGNPAYTALIAGLDNYLAASGLPRINGEGGTFGAKAHNWFRIRSNTTSKVHLALQYQRNGQWITYQTLEDFLPISSDPSPLTGAAAGSTTVTDGVLNSGNLLEDTLITENPSNTNRTFYGWRFDNLPGGETSDDNARTGFTLLKYDPRTVRFGHNELRRAQRGRTIRQSVAEPTFPTDRVQRDLVSGWAMLGNAAGSFIAGLSTFTSLQPVDAMQQVSISLPGATIPFGYMANIPEVPLNETSNPSRYRDRDGIIRPGDGYLGSVPTAVPTQSGSGRGSLADRPIILNRPFHSVGEMGYAFRDLPWKSLDFFSRNSGDLGLLDVLTLEESPEALVEGKININSAPEPVLAALLNGTGRTPDGDDPISLSDAEDLAAAIVDERTANGAYATVGDLVARVFSPTTNNVNGTFSSLEHRKSEREAAIRTLSAIADTRTWNFLIDLVVQTGRFSSNASSPAQFAVNGSRRFWVHLTLDRLTGEILQENWEAVYE